MAIQYWGEDDQRSPWMQQTAAPAEQTDWAAIEQELRARGGNLYDPSDLEGIKRNTSYTDAAGNSTGMSVDQALQNQTNIYGQRAATQQTGGQQAPQYQTPTQQWNAQPEMQGRSDDLYKLLMERATQGTAVNRNDPNIRAQVDPVVAQQERASRNYLDEIAERSGPLANMQGERRLAAERSGQAAGAFESEVIGREIAARRDEIAQALQLYGSRLTADQQMGLQRELASLEAALSREGMGLQRYGMDQSNDQFLRELALREFDTTNKWDYAWSGV
jgi:hypothetical protein